MTLYDELTVTIQQHGTQIQAGRARHSSLELELELIGPGLVVLASDWHL